MSLTRKLALRGDPAWRQAIAPVLPWVKAVWQAATEPELAYVSIIQLRRWWQAAKPEGATTWAASRGPLQRLFLSLRRVGWAIEDPFIWIDDRGRQIKLAEHSRRMIEDMLKEAIQRGHEHHAADNCGRQEFTGRRACFDIASRASRSRIIAPVAGS